MVGMITPETIDVIEMWLNAAVSDDLFPEWEFHAIMGTSRYELRDVPASWPEATTDPTEDQRSLINNVLNNLLGYPHHHHGHHHHGQDFTDRVGATEEQVEAALYEWRDATGLGRGNSYFHRMT